MALGLATLAGAQEKESKPVGEKTPEKLASRVLMLKHTDPRQVVDLLRVFSVAAVPNVEFKAISVAGSPESVAAYEEAVRRLDVPAPAPKNLEITAYILEASQQPEAAISTPAELQGVAKQLKGVFGFQGLRLLDTAVIRVRDGQSASVSGRMPYGSEPYARYALEFAVARVTEDRLLRVDRLRLSVLGTWLLDASVDFKEGQKVVVGKTGIEGSQKALILVVTGKVAE